MKDGLGSIRTGIQGQGCWRRPKTELLLRLVPTQN